MHSPRMADVESSTRKRAAKELDDVVIISDDEGTSCNQKICKTNPNCLNYVGQEAWESEGMLHLILPDRL